jgi:hypothetical protein
MSAQWYVGYPLVTFGSIRTPVSGLYEGLSATQVLPPNTIIPIAPTLKVNVNATVLISLNVFGYNASDPGRHLGVMVGDVGYVNGSQVWLPIGSPESIGVSGLYELETGEEQTFDVWNTTGGWVVSNITDETTFWAYAPGTLVALTDFTYSHWAGYVMATDVATVSTVSVTFTVPYTYSPGTSELPLSLGIWTGFGGFSTTSGLWQAGIQIEYTSYDDPVYTPWIQFGSKLVYNHDALPRLTAGDTIFVYLTPTNGSIFDSSQNQEWFFSNTYGVADTSTAEWITEAASDNSPALSSGQVDFTGAYINTLPVHFFGGFARAIQTANYLFYPNAVCSPTATYFYVLQVS